MLDILIKWLDVAVLLEQELKRVPTFKEIKDFIEYLKVGSSQWLKDNVKTYISESNH